MHKKIKAIKIVITDAGDNLIFKSVSTYELSPSELERYNVGVNILKLAFGLHDDDFAKLKNYLSPLQTAEELNPIKH